MELKHISLQQNSRRSISICIMMSLMTMILLSIVSQVSSRPNLDETGMSHHHRQHIMEIRDSQLRATHKCSQSGHETQELCQRCAKVTKSKLAYEMCCEEKENARDWCRELLMIG